MRTFLFVALLGASLAAQTPPKTVAPPSDVATPPADAKKSASGLWTKVIEPGTGKDHPAPEDVVVINFTGWTADGRMFDSSVARGKPATFSVNRVFPGFTEALTLMVTGEKRRAWIPESLTTKGQREPKGMLVFDIELLDIPNRPPADLKTPPPDATKTASGLVYKILQEGVGGRHPKTNQQITVNYTGWTTDGKMFDSSIVRGQPQVLSVDGVIPGWTEALQLMYEGEKIRVWIPESLAYAGKQAPYGNLVFDMELIRINQ
jgi:peptidylprolyl isomerase